MMREISVASEGSAHVAAAAEKGGFAPLEMAQATSPSSEQFRVLLSISGMLCAITEAKPYVLTANVVLLANSAVVDFEGDGHAEELTKVIEDFGYGAVVEEVKSISQPQAGNTRLEAQLESIIPKSAP